jgi:hypothetical protein
VVSAACGASTSIQSGHSEAAQRGCRRTLQAGRLYDQRRDGRGCARMIRKPGSNAGLGESGHGWYGATRQVPTQWHTAAPRGSPGRCASPRHGRPQPLDHSAQPRLPDTPRHRGARHALPRNWPGPIASGSIMAHSCALTEIQCENSVDRVSVHYASGDRSQVPDKRSSRTDPTSRPAAILGAALRGSQASNRPARRVEPTRSTRRRSVARRALRRDAACVLSMQPVRFAR